MADLDDDNATSLKHGNEAFLDYMLDSVFVGSKWINWLVEPVIAYAHSPTSIREIKYYFNIWGIRKEKKKGAQKKGGGVKIHPFHLPWIRAWLRQARYTKDANWYQMYSRWFIRNLCKHTLFQLKANKRYYYSHLGTDSTKRSKRAFINVGESKQEAITIWNELFEM